MVARRKTEMTETQLVEHRASMRRERRQRKRPARVWNARHAVGHTARGGHSGQADARREGAEKVIRAQFYTLIQCDFN